MTTNGERKLRAAIYVRVSTNEQVDRFGPDAQEEKIKSLLDAKSESLTFAGDEYVYKDLWVSGTNIIEERPSLSKLFMDLEGTDEHTRPFDILLVYKIDRFARKLSVLLEVVDRLNDHWVWFISAQESIDTSTPLGTAMLGMLWVFAELEKDMIQERTHGSKEKFLRGWWWLNDQYWYRRDDTKYKRPHINKAESKVIRRIFEMFVYDRCSISDICLSLQKDQIPIPSVSRGNLGTASTGNCRWWDHTVRKILSNEVYIGKYYYNKTRTEIDPTTKQKKSKKLPKEEWILSDHPHEPIIAEDLFAEAKTILSQKKGYYIKAKSDYILSWLLKCDACAKDRSRWMLQWKWVSGNKRKYYQCSWKDVRKHTKICGVVPLPKEDLEKMVIHEVKQLFIDPNALTMFVESFYARDKVSDKYEKDIKRLEKQYQKLIDQQQRLKDYFLGTSNDDLSNQEYHQRKRDIEEKIESVLMKIKEMRKRQKSVVNQWQYAKAIELLKDFSPEPIEDLLSNPKKARKFLSYIIKEIIVYSRPKKSSEKVSGKSKEGQMIPEKLHIKFRLPQEMMDIL